MPTRPATTPRVQTEGQPMALRRRQFNAAAAAWVATAALPGTALAQASYPSGPVKLIVPYAAGGATDILARTLAQKLQEAWGGSVLVENRPGASGTIGNNVVAKASPDGHTVLIGITAIVQQPAMIEKLPYDLMRDFTPVTMLARSSSVLAVPLSSPAKTVREFIAMVKAEPGKHNFGSFGNGTSSHIQGALLNMQAGLDLVHVPFQGSAPMLAQLVGAQLSAGFVDIASARTQLDRIRPLAATGAQRMAVLPQVPTFVELGYQSFEPYGWLAVFLPANVPAPVLAKLEAETNRILRLPDVVARIEGLGLQVAGGSSEEFAKTVRSEAALYARIVKEANIKLTP